MLPSSPKRRPTWYLALTLLAILASTLAVAQTPDERDRPRSKTAEKRRVLRRREGDRYQGTGEFRVTGDRITFYAAEGDGSFRSLENLALERVSRMLEDTRGRGQWEVTGLITEFRGGNYLIVQRAVLKAKSTSNISAP